MGIYPLPHCWAASRQISLYLVSFFSNDLASGRVIIKNMETGEQQSVPASVAAAFISAVK